MKWYETVTRTYYSSQCLITLEISRDLEAILTCETSSASLKKEFHERGYLEKREYRPFPASSSCSKGKIGPTTNMTMLTDFITLIAQHEDLEPNKGCEPVAGKIISEIERSLVHSRDESGPVASAEGTSRLNGYLPNSA